MASPSPSPTPTPSKKPASLTSSLLGAAAAPLPSGGARSPFAFAVASPSPPLPPHHPPTQQQHVAGASGAGSSAPGSASSTPATAGLLRHGSPVAARLEALLSEEDALAAAEAAEQQKQQGDAKSGASADAGFVLPPAASGPLGLVRSSSSHSLAQTLRKQDRGHHSGWHASHSAPLLSAQVLPANQYVQLRSGSILSRGMIVKADQFPQEELREGLDMHILGAPNFQQVRPYAIYASGQPSVSGIRTVLNLLRLKQNPRRRVQWINLREEPVVYLNNRPFVLRELEHPFHNLTDFSSISRERLEGIESRMKTDILLESDSGYGNVLVHDEVELGEIRACWNSVHEANVKTSQEVYAQLRAEKYAVSYLRVPVTAESVVGTQQLDAIVKCFLESQRAALPPAQLPNAAATSSSTTAQSSSMSQFAFASEQAAQAAQAAQGGPIETYFVINDQMGRGRSTVGMIAVYLLIKQQERNHAAQHPHHAVAQQQQGPGGRLSSAHGGEVVPASTQVHDHDGLSAYRRGEYDVMLRLLRVLRHGRSAKRRVDDAIDRCGRVHHLRDQILESFVASEHARASDAAAAFSSATAGYMKRYFILVCFQAYLDDSTAAFARATLEATSGAPQAVGGLSVNVDTSSPSASSSSGELLDAAATFTAWWSAHPELEKLMHTLDQDESMLQVVPSSLGEALGTVPPATTTPPLGAGDSSRTSSDETSVVPGALSPTEAAAVSAQASAASLSDVCNVLDLAVFRRSGAVLSKRAILMSEFHLFSTRHQRLLFEHGLPNFRYYESMPLAATAQPNVRGIRNILHILAETSRRRDRRIQAEADAHALREEQHQHQEVGGAGQQLDDKLRAVVQAHANAETLGGSGAGSPARGVLGHHSASALNLTRGVSDGSTEASEEASASLRYRAGTGGQSSAAALAQSHAHQSRMLQEAGLGRPALMHSASLPSDAVMSDFCPVLWINLREEPVLFVNEEPYVVRDYMHPFRVLTEFAAGMTRQRSEQIEAQLKVDVVAELADSLKEHTHVAPSGARDDAASAAQAAAAALHLQHAREHPGRPKIVVHEETASGHIRPRFEVVSQPLPAHVQTTAEVYAALRGAGYPLTYAHVPLHVDESPGLRSFDTLFSLLNAQQLVEEKVSVVFSCQKGGRRSTMGMVVTVLMLMHQRAVHYSVRQEDGTSASILSDEGDEDDEDAQGEGDAATAVDSKRTAHSVTRKQRRYTALSAEEKMQSLNLSLSRHRADGTPLETLELGAGQDDANVHGHTVSISAHARISGRPAKRAQVAAAANREGSPRRLPSSSPSEGAPATPERNARSGPPGSAGSSPAPGPLASPALAASPAPSATKKASSTLSIHISDVDRRSTRARYGRGEFKGILGLIRILKQGARAKEEVDVAIDAVGGIVNIRDSIAEAKTKADAERVPQEGGAAGAASSHSASTGHGSGPKRRGGLLNKALKYLESYAYLICFNAYLRERREAEEEEEARRDQAQAQENKGTQGQEQTEERHVQFASAEQPRSASPATAAPGHSRTGSGSADGENGEFPSFSTWINSRPELLKQLDYIHREAEDALKINLVALSTTGAGAAEGGLLDVTLSGVAGGDAAALYTTRAGNVLVPGSILKGDWFKGSSNPNIHQFIAGAINFRPIERFPVAGTGIPTVQGIRGILRFYMQGFCEDASAGPGSNVRVLAPQRASHLLWFNLREEPLLYVNEKPFVLREQDDPYVNIEHTGINTRRLEAMERQLRRDLLVEAERNVAQMQRIVERQQRKQQQQLQQEVAAAGEGRGDESPSPSDSGSNSSSPVAPLPLSSPALPTIDRRVLLHDEDENGNLIAVWHADISPLSVQTPQMQFLRCFEEAAEATIEDITGQGQGSDQSALATAATHQEQKSQAQGELAVMKHSAADGSVTLGPVPTQRFTARYFRTPITDEQAPSPATLDDLIRALETAREAPAPVILFNCQMGRGRTTTGLIIGCLWCIHRGKVADFSAWIEGSSALRSATAAAPKSVSPTTAKMQAAMAAQAAANAPPALSLPSATADSQVTTSTSSAYLAPSSIAGEDAAAERQRQDEFANGLRHGWYKVIQSLVRVLANGPQVKKLVDRVIDHCGTFQNLREVVYETQLLCQTCLPRKRPFFVRRGTNYLIRYFMLLLIGAYLSQEVAHDFARINFQQWLAERPEIQHILGTLQYPEVYVEPAARKQPTSTRRSTSTVLSPLAPTATLAERAAPAL